jgi:methionyl-tRNA formyltransferase
LKKSDGELDLRMDAQTLARQVRAYDPWPGSFLLWSGAPLKVHKAHATGTHSPGAGRRVVVDGVPAVGTGSGILILDLIQLPGKKALPGAEFLKGRRDWGDDETAQPSMEAEEG